MISALPIEKITLSPGKLRGLAQCATGRQVFSILALDHRNNLRQALSQVLPQPVSDQMLTDFKLQVTAALAPAASAVLLDPEYGGAQAIAAQALPGDRGLILALEATGYTGASDRRESRLLPGWSVAKAQRLGASAVKLLVYYHPEASTAAEIEKLVSQVGQECRRRDLAFFLEPLSYSLDPAQKKLKGDELRRVVLETARRLTPLGVDVLKAEFPLDIQAVRSESEWATACAALTNACQGIPWVLLSAAVDFDTYLRQVNVACSQGASGVAVGRAVWQEAVQYDGEARQQFLAGEARARMERITALVNALARPYTACFAAPTLDADWYLDESRWQTSDLT